MNLTNLKMWLIVASSLWLPQFLSANTPEQLIKPFPDESLSNWKEKSFVGNTSYSIAQDKGITVLKASTDKAASVLYRKKAVDLTTTPWLEWSWKIDNTYKNIDERSRGGDDFPARLYVTAQVGRLPWNTIAINYVWSSYQPMNSTWQNPYTKKSIMVSVQSGEQLTGKWVSQRRNIVEDFKRLFDVDVNRLSGYAVMVDGDNALQSGTAYFGNIDFVAD